MQDGYPVSTLGPGLPWLFVIPVAVYDLFCRLYTTVCSIHKA